MVSIVRNSPVRPHLVEARPEFHGMFVASDCKAAEKVRANSHVFQAYEGFCSVLFTMEILQGTYLAITHSITTIGTVGLGFPESSWPDSHLSWGQNAVRVKGVLIFRLDTSYER